MQHNWLPVEDGSLKNNYALNKPELLKMNISRASISFGLPENVVRILANFFFGCAPVCLSLQANSHVLRPTLLDLLSNGIH